MRDGQVELEIKRMPNGYEVSKCFARFICLQKIFGLCLLLQVAMSSLYYELEYCGIEDQYYEFILKMLLPHMGLTLTFCGLAHKSFNDLKIVENQQLETLGLGILGIKFFIIAIQPYSIFQEYYIENWHYFDNKNQFISANYLLALLSMFKFVLIIPCFFNTLKFKKPRSSRICKIYGCSNSYFFEIKCYFKECPVKTISIMFVGFAFIFFYAFRVLERNKNNPSDIFNAFQNCIWMVFISMISVGYGDFVPKTLLGRVAGIFCIFCGVLTISIMVVVVVNTFQLTQGENTVLKITKKLEQKKQLKLIAAKYINITLSRTYRNKQKLYENPHSKIEKETFEERRVKRQFREALRKSKINENFAVDLGEEMSKNFQRSFFQLENLNNNFEMFLKYLSEKYFINVNNMRYQK